MSANKVASLSAEASRLSPVDRIDLVDRTLQSLDASDPALERQWASEAKDRLAAYRRGEISSRDFDEALKELEGE